MLARIIFCSAVSLATIAVILLAVLSPQPHKKNNQNSRPWLDISMYIQQKPQKTQNTLASSNTNTQHVPTEESSGAFIYHRVLTEGPENTSRVVGKAEGFIIPVEQFEHSVFNVMYLTFDTPEHSGSLSVQAKEVPHEGKGELKVVGGTGSFAFARGIAVITQSGGGDGKLTRVLDASYHVKLQLEFPNHSIKN